MSEHALRFGSMSIGNVRRISLIVAAAWAVLAIIGWLAQPQQFYESYLFAWLFWLGVSLGAMGVVMIHHLMGGNWGYVVRRFGEHAAMLVPLMALLFIPILIGAHHLFPWARHDDLAHDAILRHQAKYLNVPFFLIRAVIYFACWTIVAWSLRSGSLRQDRDPDRRRAKSLHDLSAGGMVLYFLTMSFAGVDWLMSREPHWYSTVFGFIVVCGQGVAGLAFVVAVAALLVEQPPLKETSKPEYFNDLGNLLLTFVIVWTYVSFVQLLVIWMGNKQDEVPWYVQRLSNGFGGIGLVLALFHFAVPFLVLLMRGLKRKTRVMFQLCVVLLLMRVLDDFWMVRASGHGSHPVLHHVISWLDFVQPIGIGGLWLAGFLWLLDGHPLIPGDREVLETSMAPAATPATA